MFYFCFLCYSPRKISPGFGARPDITKIETYWSKYLLKLIRCSSFLTINKTHSTPDSTQPLFYLNHYLSARSTTTRKNTFLPQGLLVFPTINKAAHCQGQTYSLYVVVLTYHRHFYHCARRGKLQHL